ncbi:hypothetical protein GLAREA_11071 [Glarea lozoyensis ATCC 20868]|uniref:Uncharacterized protein n=1 Tax=Glarea lozoyensis (strain ATCC 20868 / MF5171) TaxID=1116229 RepID=S3DA99_GLAL2|nr:uncharacterized protein GLAREA_11071 [Glarea lozoyensis ATCC 20868]EPE35372.1 hypothetical protein GLAREA_11071 [Glarea lozoyensis ATCC 20868]
MSCTPQTSPPKRPRLSLQIKTPTTAVTFGKSSTAVKADLDPSSPTGFNTLANAYATAIENASPRTTKPPVDFKLKPTSLRLETKNFDNGGYVHPTKRTQTPGPFAITYPDTPSSALAGRTPVSGRGEKNPAATAFTFTPPQSAGAGEQLLPRVFTFDSNTPKTPNDTPPTPRTARRRAQSHHTPGSLPYTHPRTLHSILRNSPLPPPSTIVPLTPSRSSLRISSRAAKKVEYQTPLTQTITTAKYIKSHIELLAEDSPYSAHPPASDIESLDLALAETNAVRDGGQTPGPFEDMRRRMADQEIEPENPDAKRRKRKEKKRKWEWTINSEGGELITPLEDEQGPMRRKIAGLGGKVVIPPSPAVEREASVSTDSEMSEVEERMVMPCVPRLVVPVPRKGSEDSNSSIQEGERGPPKLSLSI